MVMVGDSYNLECINFIGLNATAIVWCGGMFMLVDFWFGFNAVKCFINHLQIFGRKINETRCS